MKFDVIKLALYTAIVYVATIVLQVYTPATRGYFNLGETAIYVVAAISNPWTAGFAGGIGSALADLTTGYSYYAPGTLVIKFVEGFVASYLVHKLVKLGNQTTIKLLSVVASIIVGAVIAAVGYFNLSGLSDITSVPLDIMGFEITAFTGSVYIPSLLWIAIGVAISAILIYSIMIKGRGNVHFALSMVIAGILMVTGYFLYEYFFVNPVINKAPPEQAFVEIPVNFGQVLVGMAVALPVVSFIKEAVGSEPRG